MKGEEYPHPEISWAIRPKPKIEVKAVSVNKPEICAIKYKVH